MKIFSGILALTIIISVPLSAVASTISGVSGASVTKGKLDVAARVGFDVDNDSSSKDNRFQSRLHFDYGVTEWWAPRLIIKQDKRNGDSLEHSSLTWENRFQLLNRKEDLLDLGFRFSYALKDGDKKPDSFSWRFIEAFTPDEAGLWDVRFNQIFGTDVGADREDDLRFETRIRATRKMNDTFKLGLESFNKFGDLNETPDYEDQNHTIGPVLLGKTDYFSYETGYRVGVSKNAPDHSFKFFIKKAF